MGAKATATAGPESFRPLRCFVVWGKANVKHKARLQQKVQTLFAAIEENEQQEEREHTGQDLPELGEASSLTSEKLESAVRRKQPRV
ncbi:hypothetical protein ACH6EH_09980 [Paenibacillus sp. JSM ZJ436]|uniref:hypothetical protein n=1 Tax=Paenibacillus sp. JSM ZJ436 TaxID=3376190 RepID=UPI0037ADC29B